MIRNTLVNINVKDDENINVINERNNLKAYLKKIIIIMVMKWYRLTNHN